MFSKVTIVLDLKVKALAKLFEKQWTFLDVDTFNGAIL